MICDSYVRPCTLVRICDECNYGSYQGRCVICGGPGVSDAYYCRECTVMEKDVYTFIVFNNFFSGTVVLKLLIWEALKRIYSTNERNMDLRKDSSILLYLCTCFYLTNIYLFAT